MSKGKNTLLLFFALWLSKNLYSLFLRRTFGYELGNARKCFCPCAFVTQTFGYMDSIVGPSFKIFERFECKNTERPGSAAMACDGVYGLYTCSDRQVFYSKAFSSGYIRTQWLRIDGRWKPFGAAMYERGGVARIATPLRNIIFDMSAHGKPLARAPNEGI